jgi:hypothetical protein
MNRKNVNAACCPSQTARWVFLDRLTPSRFRRHLERSATEPAHKCQEEAKGPTARRLYEKLARTDPSLDSYCCVRDLPGGIAAHRLGVSNNYSVSGCAQICE